MRLTPQITSISSDLLIGVALEVGLHQPVKTELGEKQGTRGTGIAGSLHALSVCNAGFLKLGCFFSKLRAGSTNSPCRACPGHWPWRGPAFDCERFPSSSMPALLGLARGTWPGWGTELQVRTLALLRLRESTSWHSTDGRRRRDTCSWLRTALPTHTSWMETTWPGGRELSCPVWRTAAFLSHRPGRSPWGGGERNGFGICVDSAGLGVRVSVPVYVGVSLFAGRDGCVVHMCVRAGRGWAWAGALHISYLDSWELADDRWPRGHRWQHGSGWRLGIKGIGWFELPQEIRWLEGPRRQDAPGWRDGLGLQVGVGWQDRLWRQDAPGWQDGMKGMKDTDGSTD